MEVMVMMGLVKELFHDLSTTWQWHQWISELLNVPISTTMAIIQNQHPSIINQPKTGTPLRICNWVVRKFVIREPLKEHLKKEL